MLILKSLLTIAGIGLMTAAAGILIHDILQILKRRRLPSGESTPEAEPETAGLAPLSSRWRISAKLAAAGVAVLLLAMSIAIVPAGHVGLRISQFGGANPRPLYAGVHGTLPLIESIELYGMRDSVYTTAAIDDPKRTQDLLRVQTREGLSVGLAVAVRYRLDPAKLASIYANLPQPIEREIVPPVVASALREIAPNYLTRELFAAKREEIRRAAADRITAKLGADGIIVKEVLLRDVQLPSEYAKGLEGLLLKEQENERMSVDLELKQKLVRAAELEAEAQKMREVKSAEGQAMVTVLQAKAQADAMQHTLPLKEKQIQQSRLEAEARKESTVKNAEALAQAKVIDSRAEQERRKLMAVADTERMRLEAEVLKQNPMLIQKIIAEKLSDKVQIVMAPFDGKSFFANDVFKAMSPAPTSH